MVALYRPGPMNEIPKYIKAKHGEVPVTYPHPVLEPILKPTYGVIVYQDQVMFIARAISGYTLGRGRHSAPRHGQEEERGDGQRSRRTSSHGAVKNGIPASDGHVYLRPDPAVCRLRLQCRPCRLLRHDRLPDGLSEGELSGRVHVRRPAERTGQHGQGSDSRSPKRAAWASPSCRPMSIAATSTSRVEGSGEGAAIRFGLAAIKNVGEGPVRDIIAAAPAQAARSRTSTTSAPRVNVQAANRRVMESLIKAGAFDALARRSQLLTAH